MSDRVTWLIQHGDPIAVTLSPCVVEDLQLTIEELKSARVNRDYDGVERAISTLEALIMVEIGQPGEVTS
jgi:hypothetical protein